MMDEGTWENKGVEVSGQGNPLSKLSATDLFLGLRQMNDKVFEQDTDLA